MLKLRQMLIEMTKLRQNATKEIQWEKTLQIDRAENYTSVRHDCHATLPSFIEQ